MYLGLVISLCIYLGIRSGLLSCVLHNASTNGNDVLLRILLAISIVLVVKMMIAFHEMGIFARRLVGVAYGRGFLLSHTHTSC